MRLFEPLQVGGMALANRIVLPAMVTRLSGEDGLVNRDIEDRYVRYARGEPGLIVVEAMAVHSSKSGPLLRISDGSFVPGLARLARRVHEASPSTRVVPQIIHFLKIARSGWRQTIHDLSAGEVEEIVERYGEAAARAREAGFDGVELHMAHAYTLSSFLSRMNRRRDELGGSLENRLRVPTRVVRRVRARVGDGFPIGVRFDGEECIKDGYSLPDSRQIGLRLVEAGADYLSISAGGKFEDAIKKPGVPIYPYTGYSGDRCMPSSVYPDGLNLYLAEGITRTLREHGRREPVVATGKISTAAFAEEVLQTGRADLIGMARQLLADPDWPRKVRAGREALVVRCQYGNVCKALDESFQRVVCTLWPKGALHAPEAPPGAPPRWPPEGAGLHATVDRGRVRLGWTRALHAEAVYGYALSRGVGGGPLVHFKTVRGRTPGFLDEDVVGGRRYAYQVTPYDLTGDRGAPSALVEIEVPRED